MADPRPSPTPLAGLPGYFVLESNPTGPQSLVEQVPPDSEPNDIFNVLTNPLGRQQIVSDAARGVPNDNGQVFFPLSTMGFSRTSAASRLTGAQTINLVAANVLRVEDRGNGNGPLTLLEGESENLFDHRRPANYSSIAGVVVNPLAGTSLVDARAQDTVDFLSGQQCFDATAQLTINNEVYTQSLWVRLVSGTNIDQLFLGQTNTQGPGFDADFQASDAQWHYITATRNYEAPKNVGQLSREAGATSKTLIWDGYQLEQRPFASSYIDIAGAPASRDPDVLSVGAGGYPERLVHQDYNFAIAPYFASGELAADVTALSFGIANELRITTSNTFQVVVGGIVIFESPPLVWSRYQMMIVSFDWLTPILKVQGATSGNFTAGWLSTAKWPLTGTGLRWGGRLGVNGQECFAGYGDLKIGVAA